MTKGGIFPALAKFGTFILVIVMSIAAVPFGTITAIYLTEYAHEKSKFAAAVRFSIRTLAGSFYYFGLFGLGFFINLLEQEWTLLSITDNCIGDNPIFFGQV